MFETVLFPTDFSERAEIMLDCIASMPRVKDVILVHVVKETRFPMGSDLADRLAEETAQNFLTSAKDHLRTVNPAITVTLETLIAQDIAEGILATAEQRGASLIVISAHGIGPKIGVLLGSVPSTVLCRISRTNVLVMRHKIIESLTTGPTYQKFCPMLFSKILCPTDFSKFSDHATALAGTMKGAWELVLLHVVPETGNADATRQAVREAETRLGSVCDGLAVQGIRAKALVTAGDPATEIIKTAEDEDVSVIWISSYGKGCLHDLLLGSTVQDVAMKASRPVIVIRSWE